MVKQQQRALDYYIVRLVVLWSNLTLLAQPSLPCPDDYFSARRTSDVELRMYLGRPRVYLDAKDLVGTHHHVDVIRQRSGDSRSVQVYLRRTRNRPSPLQPDAEEIFPGGTKPAGYSSLPDPMSQATSPPR